VLAQLKAVQRKSFLVYSVIVSIHLPSTVGAAFTATKCRRVGNGVDVLGGGDGCAFFDFEARNPKFETTSNAEN
jgi:hypothetical protein